MTTENTNTTDYDARVPGTHVGKVDGHRQVRLQKRLTPYQQVKRADRQAHRQQISQEHARTRGAINMVAMGLGKVYQRGRIAAAVSAVGHLATAVALMKLAGWF